MADDLDFGSDDGSGGGGGKSPQRADPLDFGAVEGAVNEAAKRLNAVWVTFILLMTYLFIATGKITHKDLFLETPVKLPVLGVDVPLLGYFTAAPLFILAVHFYFLIQLRGVAAKFAEYDAVLSELHETGHGHVERLRHRIDNSLYAQILGGPRGATTSFLRWVAVVTVVVFPLLLLLFIQVTFLAYQNPTITVFHRWMMFFDVGLYATYFPEAGTALFGVQSQSRSERNGQGWLARVGLPFYSAWHWGRRNVMALTVLGVQLFSVFISWFGAVLPYDSAFGPIPSFFHEDNFRPGPIGEFPCWSRDPFVPDWLPQRGENACQRWFSNRLVLPDQNLIEGFEPDKATTTRSLRDRHFVGAIFDGTDLRHVDFTGADLRFASFQRAKLEKAKFGCTSVSSSVFGCTKLQEARFDGAKMPHASLDQANLMGASLDGANIERASLFGAQLQGASLEYARLDAASLSSAALDGASLSRADLSATALSYVSVRGADFTRALMVGTVLDGALAQDASFVATQMQGASLQDVNFSGAKIDKTSVYGADVSGARFKGALIKDVSTSRRWPNTIGAVEYPVSLYTKDDQSDPFGKEGEVVSLGYADVYQDITLVDIPAAEKDWLTALFPNGLSEDESGTEIKKRLARLAPHSKTADWTKLTDKTISEDEYVKGLGERLIVIACAKAGEGHVARGLIRNGRLCPYKKEVEGVLKSSMMPNGKSCADAEGFKRIWSEEAPQISTVCKQQNTGRP